MKKFKIAFLGSDGAGKSTLINFIKKELEKEGENVEIFFMGWRNFYNPILRFFSRIYMKRKQKNNIKEEKLARFRIRSWFFYAIYYSELWLRYLRILLSRKKYNLIDRYFYDELAFAKGLKFKFFRLVTPRPNLCFLLKAPYSVLKKRGKYIPKERLNNFYSHMNKLSEIYPMIKIDSSKSLKETYKKIKTRMHLCKE